MTRTVARFGFLAVVVTVAGVLAAAIIPARAQTTTAADRRGGAGLPAGFRSWGQLFAEQEVLDRAAARVRAAAGAGSGYAGLRVDVIGHTLTVYWKGQPTAALTRNGDRVISIAAFADGSGIRVGVQRAAGPRAALAGGLPHLQQAVRTGAVTVFEQQPAPTFSREADSPPHWAGALLFLGQFGRACSSGFAVQDRGGQPFILSAAHCGSPGDAVTTGDDNPIGKVESVNNAYDTLVISANSDGRVYDGPGVFQPGQFSKPVLSAAHSNVGDILCTSGSTIGAVCGLRVDNVDMLDCSVSFLGCVHVDSALSILDNPPFAAGDGDIGGPVFALTHDDQADQARGVIHGAYGTISDSCPQPLADHYDGFLPFRRCSTGLMFTDVQSALDSFDLLIRRG